MKKLFSICKSLIKLGLLVAIIFWGLHYYQKHFNLQVEAEAAIIIDFTTGKTYYEKQADEPLAPASMSKMMTELLVLAEVQKGVYDWSDLVEISEKASNVGGVGIGLEKGGRHTIEELFQAMAIYSANDAAVALAELVSGSEVEFVEQMNEKAKSIGLSKKTIFANATGLSNSSGLTNPELLPLGETKMTARDVAKLAKYLIEQYPSVLNITEEAYYIHSNQQLFSNTNLMLPEVAQRFSYDGVDGFKTGYTDAAGYCFTGTVERDGKRLISVVMGTDSIEKRFIETKKLFDYGFSRFRL